MTELYTVDGEGGRSDLVLVLLSKIAKLEEEGMYPMGYAAKTELAARLSSLQSQLETLLKDPQAATKKEIREADIRHRNDVLMFRQNEIQSNIKTEAQDRARRIGGFYTG